MKLFLGDENVSQSVNGSIENDFEFWAKDLIDLLANTEKKKLGCKCTGKKEVNIIKVCYFFINVLWR